MVRIKGYKYMSKERLLSALDESESAGCGNDLNNPFDSIFTISGSNYFCN